VDIAQKTVSIYPHHAAECKPKPTINCSNEPYMHPFHCAQLVDNTAHNNSVISLNLHKIIIAQMLSTGEEIVMRTAT